MYLQTNKLTSYSFTDSDRSHEPPWSETMGFITHRPASSMSISIFVSVLLAALPALPTSLRNDGDGLWELEYLIMESACLLFALEKNTKYVYLPFVLEEHTLFSKAVCFTNTLEDSLGGRHLLCCSREV